VTVAEALAGTAWADRLALAPGALDPLDRFLAEERRRARVLPDSADVLQALQLTPPDDVRAVILGQDPYPTPGHAHGLAFSYRGDGSRPRSLGNVVRELEADLGIAVPAGASDLTPWARGGVLLLNAVLTVRAGEAGSHRRRGWETFTDAVLDVLRREDTPRVFMLWGADARRRGRGIGAPHLVLEAGHPSPLSVRHFAGCRHFPQANAFLGSRAVDWRL
jgi:uracil-DNA glycosylase